MIVTADRLLWEVSVQQTGALELAKKKKRV